MIDIPVYPLQWPDGMKRNAAPSGSAPFRTQLSTAINNVRKSLKLFGQDTNRAIAESQIVFSSNFGAVGLERREESPKDAGVAVWFEWDGALRCIAVDRYSRIEQNVQAIHHLVEADRTKMRYGGLEIVRASFKGHIALPAPHVRPWRQVLEINQAHEPVSKLVVESAFKRLAQTRHPDKGGSDAMMAELNTARAQALAEIGG